MNDLISRQAAIDALLHHGELENDYTDLYHDGYCDGIYDSCDVLEDLPSAQPERKKREWIDYTEDGFVECPYCHSATNCDWNKDELHFCFSCGADMRGEQKDD